MRRKEKEIGDENEIESIIRKATVCRLAMSDNDQPYVVPLNFGYADRTLYFHSAPKGKKIEILERNDRVCFEFDVDVEIEPGEKACDWGARYKSVIGFGRAVFVESPDEKKHALDLVMAQYSKEVGAFQYPEAKLNATAIIRVDIEEMTGKRS